MLTYLAADVDDLDPGREYYTFGAMVTYATNRTLYSFKSNDSLQCRARPGRPRLRRSRPTNKTVTVHIRKA